VYLHEVDDARSGDCHRSCCWDEMGFPGLLKVMSGELIPADARALASIPPCQ